MPDRPGSEAAASSPASDQPGLVVEHPEGRIEWVIEPGGRVVVRVKALDGAPIAPPQIAGKLTVESDSYELTDEGARLVGDIGKLEGALTEIRYAVRVREATWSGVLHVPAGGTAALLETPSVRIEPGTRGPNGGLVEAVGDQRVEIVIDEESGEVRAYLLDDKLEPIDVGDAELTIGVVEAEERP